MKLDVFSAVLGALVMGVAWVIREVFSHSIAAASKRSGKVGWVKDQCGFYCLATAEDGRSLETKFQPENMFLDTDPLELRIRGDLYNDTDTQLVFVKVSVLFAHPEGEDVLFKNPSITVDGKKLATISVPSHGTCTVTFSILIHRQDLVTIYARTIPVLKASAAHGAEYSLRLSGVSFYGHPWSTWTRQGDRPVVVGGDMTGP